MLSHIVFFYPLYLWVEGMESGSMHVCYRLVEDFLKEDQGLG